MLVLTMEKGSAIQIGENIFIRATKTAKGLRVAIDAPKEIHVARIPPKNSEKDGTSNSSLNSAKQRENRKFTEYMV